MTKQTQSFKSKGKARVQEIKVLAREILAFEGYSNFTLRAISSRLSISIGNLNYYFAKKQDLLHALLQDSFASYEENTQAIFEQDQLSATEQFEHFISYLIDDLQDPLTRGFFLQVWAIATHDIEVESYRNAFYEYGLNRISGLIKTMTSDVQEEAILARATFIMAAIEGSMLLLNSNTTNLPRQAYLDTLRQQCLDIALNG